MNAEVSNLIISAKRTQNARKEQWESVTVSSALAWARALPIGQMTTGEAGIWGGPILISMFGTPHFWLVLDVEALGGHDDLEANIAAAQATLAKLDHLSLSDGVQVFLTGRGFRFIWPYVVEAEQRMAFLAFLKDREGWPAIDPAPQLNKSHFRLFAYRGHPDQGKPMPVHVHKLATPGSLFVLTVEGYRSLVEGPGEPEQWLQWYEEMLPRGWVPASWQGFLGEYQARLRLKGLIVAPPGPKAVSRQGTDWPAIHQHLTAQGIAFRQTSAGELDITKLARCPVCGKREGSPYLTHTGRLRDFRQTCPAAKASGGLPPSGWVPDYQGVDEEPSFVESPAGISLDEVRQAIRKAVQDQGDKLIRTSPGSGKTHTTVEEALLIAKGQRVLYTAPTHKLAEEVFDLATRLGTGDLPISLIKGRSEENCERNDEAQRLQVKGFPPALILCPQCLREREVSGLQPCPYRQQFEELPEAGLFISTHDQATTVLLKMLQPDLWVADENARRAMLLQLEVGLGAILAVKAHLPEHTANLIGSMVQTAEELLRYVNGPYEQGRLYATASPNESPWQHQADLWAASQIDAEDRERLARDLAVFQRLKDAPEEERAREESIRAWCQRLEKLRISPNALYWLFTAADSLEGSAYVRVRQHDREPITFHLVKRHRLADLSPLTRVVILDGTGELAEAQALFGRSFELVEAGTAIKDCRKVWLQRGLGKVKARKLNGKQIRARLKEALSRLRPKDRKVLIVTHLDIEAQVKEATRELSPKRDIAVTHFWANRGLNLYQECQAVICFGTPSVNPNSALDEAMALFPDQATRERWIAWQGEADLEQSLHRIRPVFGGKTIIIMGRIWPASLGQPDLHYDQRRKSQGVLAAADRLTLFARRFGFLTKDVAALLGVLVRSAADGKGAEDSGLVSPPAGCPDSLIELFNTVGTPVDGAFAIPIIRLPGNSSWSQLLAEVRDRQPHHPPLEVRLASAGGQWTKGLGTLVAVRRFCTLMGVSFEPGHWRGTDWVITLGLHDHGHVPNRGRLPGGDTEARFRVFMKSKIRAAHHVEPQRPRWGTSGGIIITQLQEL